MRYALVVTRQAEGSRPIDIDSFERPSYGPEWDAAVEFGIDVSLIESNAELTPAERIEELVTMNRLHEEIQARTLSAEERDRLTAMELTEELARLGPEIDNTHDGHDHR